jgi:uncharacterized OB-fold protein
MTGTAIGESQDDDYRAFLSAGEFRLQCCSRCGYTRYPARWICPECLSEEFAWKPMSGDGVVETFTWYLQSFDRRFQEVPYNVALVRIAEGPRLITNVMCDFDTLKVGTPVVAEISRKDGSRPILVFRPA